MITVFLYAKLWRRTDVITDIALRSALIGKRQLFYADSALILGVLQYNDHGSVIGGIKIGGVMLGLSPLQCIFCLYDGHTL